jgi:hypothetical protein
MKLQAFPGCSGATYGGEQITIAADGTSDVSEAAAKELCGSHGFTVFGAKKVSAADKPPADKFDDMSRAEVIGYIKAKGNAVVPSTDTETLKAQARSLYSPAEKAADAAAAADRARG